MERTTLHAFAKLNLTLGVLYRRTDGYHALDSLMQSIDWYDTVTVEKAYDILVTAVGMTLPYQNTLRQAAERYCAMTGRGAHIRVIKRIPAEAGMGGGSADAAAVLYALQQLYGELDDRTLYELALAVGADVPFCLYAQQGGSLARAEGVGEALTRVAGIPMHFVVAKPHAGVSTRALFSSLGLPRQNPDNAGALRAISNHDLPALGALLYNALEAPAAALVPEIGVLKQRLLGAGALGASMTGSGSAVFGLFESRDAAEVALASVADADFSCVCGALMPRTHGDALR